MGGEVGEGVGGGMGREVGGMGGRGGACGGGAGGGVGRAGFKYQALRTRHSPQEYQLSTLCPPTALAFEYGTATLTSMELQHSSMEIFMRWRHRLKPLL